mmetsp:Transcript_61682/g.72078  ORF Transcript_61682/g.72078 Transcript_61682/m.72078 type:complete len:458 (+) Transcript_61682:71-1444(+)
MINVDDVNYSTINRRESRGHGFGNCYHSMACYLLFLSLIVCHSTNGSSNSRIVTAFTTVSFSSFRHFQQEPKLNKLSPAAFIFTPSSLLADTSSLSGNSRFLKSRTTTLIALAADDNDNNKNNDPNVTNLKSLKSLASSCGDDIRGIVPFDSYVCEKKDQMMQKKKDKEQKPILNPLLPDSAEIIGAAFRKWLLLEESVKCKEQEEEDDGCIAVGYDPRLSSPSIAASFRKGSKGLDAGLATTPAMLEWLLRGKENKVSSSSTTERRLGAVMVTASHLPWQWNGLKLFSAALGRGLNKREVAKVMEIAVQMGSDHIAAGNAGGDDILKPAALTNESDVIENFMQPYIEKLQQTIIREASSSSKKSYAPTNEPQQQQPLKGMVICVNAGNGGGGFFATKVLEPLGAECKQSSLHLTPDGTFPNHPSNPEDEDHVEATIRAMMEYHSSNKVVAWMMGLP